MNKKTRTMNSESSGINTVNVEHITLKYAVV